MNRFVTQSEELFAEYLGLLGCDFEYEQETSAGKNPDFLVNTPAGLVYCDVTEIRVDDPLTWDPTEFRRRVRDKIKAKAKQAKGLDVPFAAVIWEPNSYGWYDIEIPGAMYGNPGISIQVGPDAAPTDSAYRNVFLGGARLQRHMNTRISAVAGLRLLNPTEAEFSDRMAAAVDRVRNRMGREPDLEEIFRTIWSEIAGNPEDPPDAMDELERTVARRRAEGLEPHDPAKRVIVVDWFQNLHAREPLPTEGVFTGPWDSHWSVQAGTYRPVAFGDRALRERSDLRHWIDAGALTDVPSPRGRRFPFRLARRMR